MTDKMRQEFEAAVKLHWPIYTNFERDGVDGYMSPGLQLMYHGYQLARQSTDEQDEVWIAKHADRARRRPPEQIVIDADDVREYLRGRRS